MFAWLALVGSAFDYIENLLAWRALSAFPDVVRTSSWLGVASTIKTISSWGAGICLITAAALVAVRGGRRVGERHRLSRV